MNYHFNKELKDYSNDELISLAAILHDKLSKVIHEGRRREVLFFLKIDDQIKLVSEVFGQEKKNDSLKLEEDRGE